LKNILNITMARTRKYTSKKITKLTKREFDFEVDQWYAKFNKNYNANTKLVG